MIVEKLCSKEDILKIRDFIQETYGIFDGKINWLIDRLNFSYTLARTMNGVSEEDYRDKIRIYYVDQQIESLVITEGENRGEAFFFLRHLECDPILLEKMFDFVESHLMVDDGEASFVNLRINKEAHQVIRFAEQRGFVRSDWVEMCLSKAIDSPLPVHLKSGYTFCQSDAILPDAKAIAHSLAFGYDDQPEYVKRCKVGMALVSEVMDYRSELDILLMDETDRIVSFCTLWFDEKNKVGVLEPVGTITSHQRMGFGKLVIQEACNRFYELGGRKVYVGSDQSFYKAIGFEEETWDYVYKKSKKRC